jgi:hypothetical protein
MNDAFGILEALKTLGLSRNTGTVQAGSGSGDLKHQRLITLDGKIVRIEFCMKPGEWAEKRNITEKEGIEYVQTLSTNVGTYSLSRTKVLPCEKTWADEEGFRQGDKRAHYINWAMVHGATPEQMLYLESLGAKASDLFTDTVDTSLDF